MNHHPILRAARSHLPCEPSDLLQSPVPSRLPIPALAGALGLAVTLFAWSSSTNAHFTLTLTFDDPTPAYGDLFGDKDALAIDGNLVLIGAPGGGESGQAFLFDATTGGPPLRVFDGPTPTDEGYFGGSVAIEGNRVLIGAPGGELLRPPVSHGKAFLFDATDGGLLRTFYDPIYLGDFDSLGHSVAMQGNHVLIGAPENVSYGGAGFLFDASDQNSWWIFSDPTPPYDEYLFGASVAIDGNQVLIGAPWQEVGANSTTGQALLFDATTGALLQTFDDPTITEADVFGGAVAIDGNLVLVGASGDDTNGLEVGQAHLFDASTGLLLQTFDDPTVAWQNQFGLSVAIDGNHVLIGEEGGAHLFDAVTGELLQTFDTPVETVITKVNIKKARYSLTGSILT